MRDGLLLLGEKAGYAPLLDPDEEGKVAAVAIRQRRRVGEESLQCGCREPLGDREEPLNDPVVFPRGALDGVEIRAPGRLLRGDDFAGSILLVELVEATFSPELRQLKLRDVVVMVSVGGRAGLLFFYDFAHPINGAALHRWRLIAHHIRSVEAAHRHPSGRIDRCLRSQAGEEGTCPDPVALDERQVSCAPTRALLPHPAQAGVCRPPVGVLGARPGGGLERSSPGARKSR